MRGHSSHTQPIANPHAGSMNLVEYAEKDPATGNKVASSPSACIVQKSIIPTRTKHISTDPGPPAAKDFPDATNRPVPMNSSDLTFDSIAGLTNQWSRQKQSSADVCPSAFAQVAPMPSPWLPSWDRTHAHCRRQCHAVICSSWGLAGNCLQSAASSYGETLAYLQCQARSSAPTGCGSGSLSCSPARSHPPHRGTRLVASCWRPIRPRDAASGPRPGPRVARSPYISIKCRQDRVNGVKCLLRWYFQG